MRYLLIAAFGFLWATSADAGLKEKPLASIPSTQQRSAPKQILGAWKFVREKCEDDVKPSDKSRDVTIRFQPDLSYEISIEGWIFSGTYRVIEMRNSPLRVQIIPSLYNFDLIDGRLENWSEGEAVLLCGRIFEREQ